ncbi:hypothetical protein FRB99_007352 [Tulasnella sp. 403]|nr:hypothetical protein FRB99_007352 [Tulasnella sp. 403]
MMKENASPIEVLTLVSKVVEKVSDVPALAPLKPAAGIADLICEQTLLMKSNKEAGVELASRVASVLQIITEKVDNDDDGSPSSTLQGDISRLEVTLSNIANFMKRMSKRHNIIRRFLFAQSDRDVLLHLNTALSDATLLFGVYTPPSPESPAPCIKWDVRMDPSHARILELEGVDSSPIGADWPLVTKRHPPTRTVRLIARRLPWAVVVSHPDGILIGHVLDAIHQLLSGNASKADFEALSETERIVVARTFQRNYLTPGLCRTRGDGLKRVDFLGSETNLCGIHKDDELIALRVPEEHRRETFVVEFCSNARHPDFYH